MLFLSPLEGVTALGNIGNGEEDIIPKLALSRLKGFIPFDILYLIGSCIPWPVAPRKLGRPYVYSPTVILRCFIVRIWFRLGSNNALHIFLNRDCQYNHKLALACGLATIPCRRTFDSRSKTLSTDIKKDIDNGISVRYRRYDKSFYNSNRPHALKSKW